MENRRTRAVRSTTKITLNLKPEAAERFRLSAEHHGMSLASYLAALVSGEERLPIPSSHARIGGCIVDAIRELEQPAANLLTVVGFLREAQRLGVEFARAYLPAFEATHSNGVRWESTDRPQRS